MGEVPSRSGYDVAVIGAGVIGLSCAWRVAESGLSVIVLDRDAPGAGASGVAAGMLAPVTEASFGEEALLRLNLESASRWPAFDEELRDRSALPTGYERRGALVVAVDRDDAEELGRLYRFQQSLGLEVAWLTRGECRRLEPRLSPGVAGGISAPQDRQAEPRALIRALAAAVERAGGEVTSGWRPPPWRRRGAGWRLSPLAKAGSRRDTWWSQPAAGAVGSAAWATVRGTASGR